ncbi:MAG: XdhC family protein [Rhodanobacteraceae bacterium]
MNACDELGQLLAALRALDARGQRAALITLTRTRGATFRQVGTRMLVYEDGSNVCELSGGCPQRDIMAHAMAAMADGKVRQVRYNAESGLDLLMEMGCGGELEVLVEPLHAASDLGYVVALSGCQSQRRASVLATVFAHDGQVGPTRHVLWSEDELVHDSLADPALRAVIATSVADGPARPASRQFSTQAGQFDVLVERVPPPHALVVIGSSSAARALLPLAGILGWTVTLVDFDAQRVRTADLPEGIRSVCAQPAELIDKLQPDSATSVVVMTHSLHKDAEYLAALRAVPLAYLGLLGARQRVDQVLALADAQAMDIHAPVGLDIGSESPAEIALSIVAEIIAATRGHPGRPLRERQGSIH